MVQVFGNSNIDKFGITPTMLRDNDTTVIVLDGKPIPCCQLGCSDRTVVDKKKSYVVSDYDVQCTIPDNSGEYLWFTFTTDVNDTEILYVTY